MNPYFIDGPAVVQFSGGRSSAYMLRQILEAHDGVLPADVFVCFQNTGKEMPETLDFVRDVSERWNVPIVWLEFQRAELLADRWKVVTHATASRNGDPFAAVIQERNYLPNPVTRFCTSELKVNAVHRYIRAVLKWDHWTSIIGIRGDEPRRLARISAPNKDRDERYAPMGRAGVSAAMVGAFWRDQPFDLGLPNTNGKTMHGNCDLCFLKHSKQVQALIREKPERALWWMAQEKVIGASARAMRGDGTALFRIDRASYHSMHRMAVNSGELFPFDDAESIEDCNCID